MVKPLLGYTNSGSMAVVAEPSIRVLDDEVAAAGAGSGASVTEGGEVATATSVTASSF